MSENANGLITGPKAKLVQDELINAVTFSNVSTFGSILRDCWSELAISAFRRNGQASSSRALFG